MISLAHAADAPGASVPFLQQPETWLAVAFVIFVGALARPVWRKATAALDARGAEIAATLEEARALREEAQATLAAYQRKQRDAAKEAQAIIAHAEEEGRRVIADAETALAETLRRREALTADKIAQAEAKAVAEVKAEAVEIALAATERLLRERLDETKADALVDTAVRDLPARLR